MKNYEIQSICNALSRQQEDMKLPISVAWKRRQNIAKLLQANGMIDGALRDIQKAYADEEHSDSLGNDSWQIKPEFMDEYGKQVEELLNQDTEIVIQKVPLSAIGDITVSDAQLQTLAFMISEEEENAD